MTRQTPRTLTLFLLLITLLLSLAAGCRGQAAPSSSGTQVAIDVSPNPPVVGPARVTVHLANSSGQAVEGAEVVVEGNMSHAGMVPVRAAAQPAGEGRYVTQDFRFTMGGDWLLTVEAQLPGGEQVERTIDVKNVTGEMQMSDRSGEMQMGEKPGTTPMDSMSSKDQSGTPDGMNPGHQIGGQGR